MPGHWEGDLVIGKDGKSAVATLVERVSRFLILVPLTWRDALTVGEAVIAAVDGLPAAIRRSLTWDCGTEMARHVTITATGLPVYFAHPHSPWERGSYENLNRILREFFPKGVTITSDPNYLATIASEINDRPVRFTTGRSPPNYSPNSSKCMLPLPEPAMLSSMNLDARLVEALITGRTRVIILVHYGGLPADMDEVMKVARRHGVVVIEDCAHSLGAEYRGHRPGALADIGCFSFHSTKNITTLGEGRMLTCNRDDWAERIDRIRSNEADATYVRTSQEIGGRDAPPRWMPDAGEAYTHRCVLVRAAGGRNTTSVFPAPSMGRFMRERVQGGSVVQ